MTNEEMALAIQSGDDSLVLPAPYGLKPLFPVEIKRVKHLGTR